ncbi:MAG TPA: glycoside hydrolase family 44 protein [Thermoanaerobaculia bacterium]|nr:glycoside hydrolase family 44 protein [Thermoanaerobaculia bacterium]
MNYLLALVLAQTVTTIDIDATADRHRISPQVYGVNFATTAQLLDLNVQLNRSGGNTTTRYNWQQNAANHAHDWYYQSLEHGPAVAGEETDNFIQDTLSGSAQPMVTIPMIGWVAKMGPNRQRLSSFSIAKYGAQQDADWQWFPDSGNGVRTNGTLITNNDPHDANTPVDSSFMAGWVQHLKTTWGGANGGGVRYYILDNEPSIWHGTHRDVRPNAPGMDEMFEKIVDYGEKVKSVDPDALVVAPEEWGWSGYLLSGYDQQYGANTGDWGNLPDKAAHGGWDYLPWLLAKFHEHEQGTGRKLVDVFTVHYYPQGGEYGGDVSQAMQLRRNRSTRSLWDPNYTDETWIGDEVRLVPRLKEWVDRYDPLTPIGLTEYNWGAEAHMNGATAQADVLGILGREGMDLATLWVTPATGSPMYNAVKMYRNYDGSMSTFGDISIRATAPNPDVVAAFAAIRSVDRALTIMLINKQLTSTATVALNVANYTRTGSAARWQLTAAGIAHVADAAVSANITLPAQSVTILAFPGTTDVTPPSLTFAAPVMNEERQYSFSGTASDTSGIASVKLHVSGGSAVDLTATGTTSWTAGPIALQNGCNHITVTAYDTAGNPTSLSKVVAHEIMAPPPVLPRRSTKRRSVR